jgi:hypothetical protein
METPAMREVKYRPLYESEHNRMRNILAHCPVRTIMLDFELERLGLVEIHNNETMPTHDPVLNTNYYYDSSGSVIAAWLDQEGQYKHYVTLVVHALMASHRPPLSERDPNFLRSFLEDRREVVEAMFNCRYDPEVAAIEISRRTGW